MTELLNTLYVQTPGTSLHLDGDTVRVFHPDQTGRRLLPLVRIDHFVVFGGVNVTDDLILRCADDGRSISWLTGNGRFRARSPDRARIATGPGGALLCDRGVSCARSPDRARIATSPGSAWPAT